MYYELNTSLWPYPKQAHPKKQHVAHHSMPGQVPQQQQVRPSHAPNPMRNERNTLRDLAAATSAASSTFQTKNSPTKEQIDAVFGMSGASSTSTANTSSSSQSGRPSLQDLVAAIPSDAFECTGSSSRPPGLSPHL